ncbi:hypothetical protein R1flu_025379 [Riccia fluitans]|uniref:Uncharacterized protein n=1 Tax=Riccia fluitans TaxID=41844 RepID=A0ABD1XXL2_9MARC
MDGKAMDVVGSNQGSQPPQEMPDIVEADDGTASNESMPAKLQFSEDEDGVSLSLPSNGEQTASETPTDQQPSTKETQVDPVGVDQGLPGWSALDIPFDVKVL